MAVLFSSCRQYRPDERKDGARAEFAFNQEVPGPAKVVRRLALGSVKGVNLSYSNSAWRHDVFLSPSCSKVMVLGGVGNQSSANEMLRS